MEIEDIFGPAYVGFVFDELSNLELSEQDATWLAHGRYCLSQMKPDEDGHWSDFSNYALGVGASRTLPMSPVCAACFCFHACRNRVSWRAVLPSKSFEEFMFHVRRVIDDELLKSMWVLLWEGCMGETQ